MEKTFKQEKIEAGQLRQILIGLVDVAFAMLFVLFISFYHTPSFLYEVIASLNSSFVVFICLIFYRLISLFFFNSTIGMKLFRVILLNGAEQFLSKKENLLAGIFILYKGTDYYKR